MARRFRPGRIDDDHGGMSILAMFLMVTSAILAGFAVDVSHLIESRTQLQVTTDLTAHAALYSRDTMAPSAAKTAALGLTYATMPQNTYGAVVRDEDIVFGHWDSANQRFTADPNATDAVKVVSSRLSQRANPVSSFLLHLIGYKSFNLRTQAIFTTFRPACFREGFVAEGIVDIQSNNSYFNGFCIHSNTYVSVNSNNFWEPGTVVSMPDLTQLDLPQSGFETNTGLQAALRKGYYQMRLIHKLPSIIAHLGDWQNAYQPDYITYMGVLPITATKVTPASFVEHKVYSKTCGNSSGKITFDPGTYRNIVFTTNCKVTFANGAILEDVIVASTNTDAKSITAPQGVQIGKDDHCATGGGAQVLTLGGMDFAANLGMFGGQLVAKGDIDFAARADGLQGASLVSGGEINGTSNMSMALCGNGMEDNLEANYFRLAL